MSAIVRIDKTASSVYVYTTVRVQVTVCVSLKTCRNWNSIGRKLLL